MTSGVPGWGRDRDRLAADVRALLAAADRPTDAAGVLTALGALQGRTALPGAGDLLRAAPQVEAMLTGLGPLQPLLDNPAVTDVLVNGADQVWMDAGDGCVPTGVRFADESTVRAFAIRLAAVSGRRLDEATPFVDARLPGGVRVHAVLPPVSPHTLISLRIPARTMFTMTDLAGLGTIPDEWVGLLRAIVRHRLGFLVSGGTGTGKTTLLAGLLAEADPADRVVVVEDTAELRPSVPHLVSLQARPANTEGAGAVTLAHLVRQALRMRPDRLVLGECRGAEVVDLLVALNTGHRGCATIHANSAAAVPARLEALGLLAGVPQAAIARQITCGVDVVVHVARSRSGQRQVQAIGVVRADGGVQEAVRWSGDGTPRDGPGQQRLAALLEHS